MIERHIIKELMSLIEFFPVTGLIGPRQVGKTTLVKQISKQLQLETIYLDLENPKDSAKLRDPVLYFESNLNKCVILDEIQRMPELFPILRSMVDNHRVASRFIILGSATPDLIRDSSESLAGRIAYKELSPFNITEIWAPNNNIQQKHWLKGGFPDAWLAPSEALSFEWQYQFTKTYIERDLPMLGLSINRSLIRKFWTMLAHLHGQVVNMSNLARSLDLSSNSINKYLSFLENAFLIKLLPPFATNLKKRLVKSPKVFIRDSGILHYLLNLESMEDLKSNPVLGHSWEGYVIEQISQKLHHNIQPYYYRTHVGAECDLVLIRSGKPIMGLEIKYTSSPSVTKGMLQSFSDLETTNNFVITPNTDDYLLKENIRVCDLVTFLNKYLPT